METDEFAERLAQPTPTPGGGAAAARVGVYACSLIRMATGITLKKLPAPREDPSARRIQDALDAASAIGSRFRELEAEDMAAFQAYLDTFKLPKETAADKEKRRAARLAAAWRATAAPLATMAAALDVLRLASTVLELSKTTPLKAESDLGAAVELAHACFRVAELNVQVNLPELGPEKLAEATDGWKCLLSEESALYGELWTAVREHFSKPA